MLHQFSRAELLLGSGGIEKLKQSKVAVFGVGGVGSFAVEALARTGVGHLVLIDHDTVCLTNLNRQLHANHQTIDHPKVEVMRDRILSINPEAEVEIHQTFYLPGSAEELIRPDYDYIIDAIDTVTAKIDLILQAKAMGIPVISSMGTGNKLDPTRLEVSDISKTSVCPLAKVMRKELRLRGVKNLKVVYSKEDPIQPGETEESAGARKQIPGSVAFVPSVAGLILAGEVIKDLIGYGQEVSQE